MDKQNYRTVRRWIRDNGQCAYRWIASSYGQNIADKLRDLNSAQDWLVERADIVAYCHREGLACTVRHTGRM